MVAVPLKNSANEPKLTARLADESSPEAKATEPAALAPAPAPAPPSTFSLWFSSAGLALWSLRWALGSGSISATVHLAAIIALAVIHAPPPLNAHRPPLLPIEATIVMERERPVLPQFIPEVKLHVEGKIHSVAPENQTAQGNGSAGSGGGRGGGSNGGVQIAGINPGNFNTSSGGTGFGTDDAFGTHMLGDVGELASPSATFFGVKAEGKKFAFVVDTSGSMQTNSRFLRCRAELLRSLSTMNYGQQFFVVFFSDQLYPMPEHKLVDARPTQLKKTAEWAVGAVPSGGTEPWPGLALALRLKPDAIYLLTDGQFNPDVVDKVINAQKQSKKIPIHTIAFESPQGAQLLDLISRATGGQHQFVP